MVVGEIWVLNTLIRLATRRSRETGQSHLNKLYAEQGQRQHCETPIFLTRFTRTLNSLIVTKFLGCISSCGNNVQIGNTDRHRLACYGISRPRELLQTVKMMQQPIGIECQQQHQSIRCRTMTRRMYVGMDSCLMNRWL